MSCRARESGSYKIPRSEFVGLRKALVDAHNAQAKQSFDRATALYKYLQKQTANTRGVDCLEIVRQLQRAAERRSTNYYYNSYRSPEQEASMDDQILEAMGLRGHEKVLFSKVKLPRQSMWPALPARTTAFQGPNWGITLSPDSCTASYSADDNHGCTAMHEEEPVTMAFFKALSKIKWGRGSGGWIVYTDEYMQDSRYAEDHASTSYQYGPLGKDRRSIRTTRARPGALKKAS